MCLKHCLLKDAYCKEQPRPGLLPCLSLSFLYSILIFPLSTSELYSLVIIPSELFYYPS